MSLLYSIVSLLASLVIHYEPNAKEDFGYILKALSFLNFLK